MIEERTGIITFQGNPLTLIGKGVSVGEAAPECCDLPFAQTRWCGAAGVDAVETLSDHRDLSFGTAYGVAIKELRLLSRAVFVICANGVIAYEQIVKEVTHDVDFEAALGAVKACLEK